jgi:homoprotocatechuate degradation regulator HpaR
MATRKPKQGDGAPAQPPSREIARRNLPLLLLQAREAVLSQFRPLLNAQGITEQQWRIVRALAETGPLEPRQIVTLCGISSPSLAGVLARMAEMGLVERERLETDLRRQHVSLTAGAHALLARMAPQVEAQYALIEARVGHEKLQAMYAALDAFIDCLAPPDDGN